MRKLRLFLLFISLAFPLGLFAQIKVYPHEGYTKKQTARIRSTHPAVPVGLPFWDDFSFTEEGENPLDLLWLDNSKVVVSSGQGNLPPSINVATFDGIDAFGIPYNPAPGDEQVLGYRDTLVSQPITLDSVLIQNRDSVYLSFSFQAGGNGEPPDEVDFLLLEFKDVNDEWNEAALLNVDNAPDPTKFYDTLIQVINADSLFHHNFQFRFISFGRRSGKYDTWHIDYVYLNEHRHANDTIYPDRALSAPLGPIFGDYYAMPIKHFFNNPTVNAASFFIQNLSATTTLEYNTSITSIKNYENAPTVKNTVNLDVKAPLQVGDVTFPGFSVMEVFMKEIPDKNDQVNLFNPTARDIQFTMTVSLDTADNKPVADSSDYIPRIYAPIDFRLNDTLQVNYFLDTAYAYDDGVAEYSAGLVHSGNEMAYRFENIHSGQDSILNGVSIYFPTFAGSESATTIRFFILNDNGGQPGSIIYEENIPIERTTGNQFHSVLLSEGVIIDGPFYIGYREPSSGKVRIGLDKSNNTGDRMYFRISPTSEWLPNDEIAGSLMFRPTFGPHEIVVSGLPEERPSVSIFPNPNRGEFYIQGQVSDIQLMSITGQPVPFAVENLQDKLKVSATVNALGIYIIRYKSGQRVETQKVLFIH